MFKIACLVSKMQQQYEQLGFTFSQVNINNDGLLCREIVTAKPMMDCWLSELVSDCDAAETKILTDILISAKNTLRKNRITE